jgi:hypothetical protein
MTGVRSFARSLDVRIVLIVFLIAVSTVHVGRLFAERENVRSAFAGYVLALSVDGVLAVSLYEVLNVRRRSHRAFALGVFLFACTVSAGFNTWYYRQNYPLDPVEISLMLGLTAPVLAAALALLKAMGDVQRATDAQAERGANAECERSLQLKMYAIEQAEQTKRTEIAERERTKRERANAKTEQAKANAIAQAHRTQRTPTERRTRGELDGVAQAILLTDPDIGPRPLARELGVAPSTASAILKRLNGNGRK